MKRLLLDGNMIGLLSLVPIELSQTKIVGTIYPDGEYSGCPYCKAKSFIVCGSCGKLNCNNTEEKVFTCGWCGAKGELIDYEGDGINSSGDV